MKTENPVNKRLRLDRFLSERTQDSRAEIKKAIRAGMVSVAADTVRDPGSYVGGSDTVVYKGREIRAERFVYYMLNKPAGVISATEDPVQKTVLDLIREEDRRKDFFPAGRLDKDTHGLLLITNDGPLGHRLLSPAHHVDKVYYAVVSGKVTPDTVKQFSEGLAIDPGRKTLPAELEVLGEGNPDASTGSGNKAAGNPAHSRRDGNQTAESPDASMKDGNRASGNPEYPMEAGYAAGGDPVSFVKVTIREGKYHQIKRMFHAVGMEVLYLKRLQMGSLILDPELEEGSYRSLTDSELAGLLNIKN